MTSTEEGFPRGGYVPTANAQRGGKKRQEIKNLFGNAPPTTKSKNRRKTQHVEKDTEATSVPDFIKKTEAMTAVSADTLTYNKIHEGMRLLACVKRVNTLNVDIELPGRCFGEIQIQNISAQYTQLISDYVETDESEGPTPEAIFQPGNFLPVRVLKVEHGDDKRVFCSCSPPHVNQHYKHADFKRNMLVWGAIKEKSDHGYLVDMGVQSCRAHLPFEAVDDEREYPLGAVLYLTVTKSVGGPEATTLTLSARKEAFDKTFEHIGTSLDKVIPGMRVAFLVQKRLQDGLQGQYFNECVGLVNELYLQKPFDDLKQYKEFRSVQARLLYVHPVSRLGYFTLKPVDHKLPEKQLSKGACVAATVASKAGAGLLVRLEGGFKGFVTHRRLLKVAKVADEETESLEALIASKFPAGSTRQCTVLDYNHTEALYICTFERITKVIDIGQLAIGQVVKGSVRSVNDYGVVINVGMLEAFAPKDHLSNVRYSQVIRSQFQVGQEVNAKVWSLVAAKHSIYLTLKPDLLASDAHLASYEDFSPTAQYPGVVRHTTREGALIAFYNDVVGWLPARNVPQLGDKDARGEFRKGQVVRVRVAHCADEKFTLTMNLTPEAPDEPRLKLGRVVRNPTICEVTPLGLYVTCGAVRAFVPNAQLAVEGVGKLLSATYKVGEQLREEAICLLADAPSVLSVRERAVHAREDLKIAPKLQADVVVRALKTHENGFRLPVARSTVQGLDANNSKLTNGLSRLQEYDTVCAKVVEVREDGKVRWDCRFNSVFSFNYLETLEYLDQYLGDVERLRNRYIHVGDVLSDLEVGATVECVVDKVDPRRGCTVFVLPAKCAGLVSLADLPERVDAGDKVPGKVLWVNYEAKYAAVTLRPETMGSIGDAQREQVDLNAGPVGVRVLHANRHVAVGVLGEAHGKRLVYLPVKRHESDVTPRVDYYDAHVGKEMQCVVRRMGSSRMLAMDVGMVKFMKGFAKSRKIIIVRNTKRDEVDVYKDLVLGPKKEKKQKVEEESDEGIASAEDRSGDDENQEELDEQMEVEEVVEVPKKKKKAKKRKSETDQSSETQIKKSKGPVQENDAEELVDEVVEVSKKTKKEKKRKMETDELSQKSNGDVQENDNEKQAEEVEGSKKKKKKMKMEADQSSKTEITQSTAQDEQVVKLTKKQKRKLEKLERKKEVVEYVPKDKPVAILSGMSSFFDEEVPTVPKDESDDEDQTPQPKKKLTPAERLQRAKDEEARLRRIETELADSSVLPQSAEQFDRALLGNPDDSELWTRYIAFHAQSTEFDKARGVARRAIERISYTAMQDRLNVWLAYLNLENLYGTKESFNAAFAEAARSNDALTVHLEAIRMMADAGKYVEMEEKIRKARGAFKQEAQMWLEVGKIYYRCGKFAEARRMKDSALLTLVDKKSHMQIIVKYAIMEFVHGEAAQGEALFETILQADPKRVDIWCSYVDQLIKTQKVDLARNVLTRAVGQKLPYKKMRTLFKKYHAFELQHGDEEQLARVKELLREYGDQ